MLYYDHIVTAQESGMMLETLLRPLHFSRKLRRLLKEEQAVLVNGQAFYWRNRVLKGDHITVRSPLDDRLVVEPEDIPIAVAFEDDLGTMGRTMSLPIQNHIAHRIDGYRVNQIPGVLL